MSYKLVETKEVNLSTQYSVVLHWYKTNYGFKHECILFETNEKGYSHSIGKTKACYYNRTWECYEYQTVILQAIDSFVPSPDKEVLYKHFKEIHSLPGERDFLTDVCAISKLFAITCGDDKETATKFQKKFLEKVPGINFPEDFDSLPLEERERRLNGAIDLNLNKE